MIFDDLAVVEVGERAGDSDQSQPAARTLLVAMQELIERRPRGVGAAREAVQMIARQLPVWPSAACSVAVARELSSIQPVD